MSQEIKECEHKWVPVGMTQYETGGMYSKIIIIVSTVCEKCGKVNIYKQ